MSTVDPDELAWLMAAMADDQAMVIPFVAEFGDQLASTVRAHLCRFGRRDLARDHDEVTGLVWDVALFLQARAGAWAPGGARPWNWARRGIAKLVADAIGHARADVDLEALDHTRAEIERGSAPDPVAPSIEVDLADLVGEPRVALLRRALEAIDCRRRDRLVHVEYRLQWAYGDPSPANTVGELFGLRPDHVRQIDRRVRTRLQALARGDATYAPLADLPWLTGLRPTPERDPNPGMAA